MRVVQDPRHLGGPLFPSGSSLISRRASSTNRINVLNGRSVCPMFIDPFPIGMSLSYNKRPETSRPSCFGGVSIFIAGMPCRGGALSPPVLPGSPCFRETGQSPAPAKADKRTVRRPLHNVSQWDAPYFFSGIVKINRVLSGSLSAFRVPLCSAAMAAAMLSPRPKPDCSPREASAR